MRKSTLEGAMQNQELSVGYNRFAFGCNRTTRHPGRDAE